MYTEYGKFSASMPFLEIFDELRRATENLGFMTGLAS